MITIGAEAQLTAKKKIRIHSKDLKKSKGSDSAEADIEVHGVLSSGENTELKVKEGDLIIGDNAVISEGLSDANQNDFFGTSVAIYGDTLVVGASGAGNHGAGNTQLNFTTNDDIVNRRYRILYTDDLSLGKWTPLPLGAFAPSSYGNITFKNFKAPGAAETYFFKVEAFFEE